MDVSESSANERSALAERRQDSRPLLSSRAVCEHFGIVPRTLHRWVADRELAFPKPLIVKRRQYWRPREIEDFELTRKDNSKHAAA